MKLLLLSGSFHANSKSLMIARAIAREFAAHRVSTPNLSELPFFCEELNNHKPDVVNELLETVTECDGIVCVTPEYNHSIPAVLKNAIDWASRPAFNSPLKDKPVTIITQAESPVGGARVQAHLKLVLDSTLSLIYPSHEMMITSASEVITAEGKISDPKVLARIHRHIGGFLDFIGRVTGGE